MEKENNQTTQYPQLIITGRGVSKENAEKMRSVLKEGNYFAYDFIHPNGDIGYFDAAVKAIDEVSLRKELEDFAFLFNKSEIAVTLMSGPPKTQNRILKSFLVQNGKVKEDSYAHSGHPAPKRYQSSR